MKVLKLSMLFIFFFSLFLMKNVNGVTVTFVLNDTNQGLLADSYTDSFSASSNYGTSASIYVRSGNNASSVASNRRIWFLFNTSVSPANFAVTNANLSVDLSSQISGQYRNLTAYNTTPSWTEGNLTWNGQPANNTKQDMINQTLTSEYSYWNVTNGFLAQTSQTNKNFSIEIMDSAEGSSATKLNTYWAKEHNSLEPQLTLSGTDSGNPTYSSNQTNSTTAEAVTKYSLYLSDNVELSYAIPSFDNCTGALVNQTAISLSGTNAWANFTTVANTTTGCTIRWCEYFNDTSNNWNGTSCLSPFSYVTAQPKLQWSANSSTVPAIYDSTTKSIFNITVTSDLSISMVLLQANWTGSATNYSMTSLGSGKYGYEIILPAGVVQWKIYINDSSNNKNTTDTYLTSAIGKGALAGTITLTPSITNTYPTQTSATVSGLVSGGGTDVVYQLWRNNTMSSTATGSAPSADTNTYGASVYAYKLNTSSATFSNYSANISIATVILTITQRTPTIHLYLNATELDKAYTQFQIANFTVNLDTLYPVTVNLTMNMTGWTNQSGSTPFQNITNMTQAGTFTLNATFYGDTNYTAVTVSHYPSVSLLNAPPQFTKNVEIQILNLGSSNEFYYLVANFTDSDGNVQSYDFGGLGTLINQTNTSLVLNLTGISFPINQIFYINDTFNAKAQITVGINLTKSGYYQNESSQSVSLQYVAYNHTVGNNGTNSMDVTWSHATPDGGTLVSGGSGSLVTVTVGSVNNKKSVWSGDWINESGYVVTTSWNKTTDFNLDWVGADSNVTENITYTENNTLKYVNFTNVLLIISNAPDYYTYWNNITPLTNYTNYAFNTTTTVNLILQKKTPYITSYSLSKETLSSQNKYTLDFTINITINETKNQTLIMSIPKSILTDWLSLTDPKETIGVKSVGGSETGITLSEDSTYLYFTIGTSHSSSSLDYSTSTYSGRLIYFINTGGGTGGTPTTGGGGGGGGCMKTGSYCTANKDCCSGYCVSIPTSKYMICQQPANITGANITVSFTLSPIQITPNPSDSTLPLSHIILPIISAQNIGNMTTDFSSYFTCPMVKDIHGNYVPVEECAQLKDGRSWCYITGTTASNQTQDFRIPPYGVKMFKIECDIPANVTLNDVYQSSFCVKSTATSEEKCAIISIPIQKASSAFFGLNAGSFNTFNYGIVCFAGETDYTHCWQYYPLLKFGIGSFQINKITIIDIVGIIFFFLIFWKRPFIIPFIIVIILKIVLWLL